MKLLLILLLTWLALSIPLSIVIGKFLKRQNRKETDDESQG